MTSRIRIRRVGDSFVGAIDVGAPGMGARLVISAMAGSKAQALSKAALLAERITEDPVMRSLLPPQALVAVKAAKMLGNAAQRGVPALEMVWNHLQGDGKRRLAASLVQEAADNSPDEVAGFGSFVRRAAKFAVNPIAHTKATIRAARAAARAMGGRGGRKRQQEPEYEPEYEPEDIDDGSEEVGILPLALLAAKYGPGLASAAHRVYKARKAKQKAKAERAAQAQAQAQAQAEAEPIEDVGYDDVGGDEMDDLGDVGGAS